LISIILITNQIESEKTHTLVSMKLAINLSLFFFALFTFGEESISLTDYKIKKICKKEKRQSACIKILQEKKLNLQKGILIEIPVIPYKNK